MAQSSQGTEDPSPLSWHDSELGKLREKHPGWRVWYVPGIGQTAWCAQPLPNLTEYSPEALSRAIREVEHGAATKSDLA